MKCNKLILLTFIIWIAVGVDGNSQGIVKKGQVGFRFLENPISAEAIGRGGLGLITIRNANTVFWNPAGLGWIEGKYDVNLNYTKGIAEINHSSVVGAFNLPKIGVFALDFLIMDYGDFYGTRRADNDQGFIETGSFSPGAFSIGLSFSQKVSDRFSYGVRLKYARQDLADTWIGMNGTDVDDPELKISKKSYSLGEPAIDIGAIYDFFYNGLRFGAAIQNFSREIKYEDEKFPLPFAVSFSLTVNPLAFFLNDEAINSFYIGFETRHPRDFKEKYKIGAEYKYANMFVIRSGYMGNYDERGLTLGLGLCKTYLDHVMRIDYAYEDYGIFDNVHIFSLGMTY